MMRRWHLHVTHPRYFGYFNPSVTPASIMGDALAVTYNPQLAVWAHSPIGNEIEWHVLNFFLSRFGFDPDAGFANFTSGGAEANHTAVLVALTARFPEFGECGWAGRVT